jgi:hypothetical protein
LLNLGPVIGQNIAFFGDRLSCKIFVEDLFADIETHAKRGAPDAIGPAIDARLHHAPGSIDGILCWDVFDYLDKKSSQRLASKLVTLLKPGGALYAFFATAPAETTHYTRFVVESPTTFRLKSAQAVTRRARHVMVTRDINKMFEGLVVAESVLLKSATRETLFRKPAAA